ncbi:MAG: hypothetical protein ACLQVY_01615 [Limisphaerales bacterium]
MIELKIQAEADTLAELKSIVEHLKKEYAPVLVLDEPLLDVRDGKKYLQNFEARKTNKPN